MRPKFKELDLKQAISNKYFCLKPDLGLRDNFVICEAWVLITHVYIRGKFHEFNSHSTGDQNFLTRTHEKIALSRKRNIGTIVPISFETRNI
jgi:hypothetical protein